MAGVKQVQAGLVKAGCQDGEGHLLATFLTNNKEKTGVTHNRVDEATSLVVNTGTYLVTLSQVLLN